MSWVWFDVFRSWCYWSIEYELVVIFFFFVLICLFVFVFFCVRECVCVCVCGSEKIVISFLRGGIY